MAVSLQQRDLSFKYPIFAARLLVIVMYAQN